VLLGVLFIVMLMAGIAGAMYHRSVTSSKATARNTLESRLLMTAESGLSVSYVRLQTDSVYPVRDIAGFRWEASTSEYVGSTESLGVDDTKQIEFTLRVQYLNGGVPVMFDDRADPKNAWDTVRVASSATAAGLEREVAAWYRLELGPECDAAILCDAKTFGVPAGGGNVIGGGKMLVRMRFTILK
jgi:hypothetical protein